MLSSGSTQPTFVCHCLFLYVRVHTGYDVCPTKGLCEPRREPFTQPGSSKSDRSPRRRARGQGVQHHEVMDGPLEAHSRDAHPRLPQLVGIRLPSSRNTSASAVMM